MFLASRSFLLFFICFIAFINNALATNSYTPPIVYHVSTVYGGGGNFNDINSACTFGAQGNAANIGTGFTSVTSCSAVGSANYSRDEYVTYVNGSGNTVSNVLVGTASQSCKTGESISGLYPNVVCTAAACVAPAVWNSNTNSCQAPCVAGCNGACGQTYSQTGESGGSTCIGGCSYKTLDGISSDGSNHWVYSIGNNTGSFCTNGQATATPPASPCPVCDCLAQGKSFGTVNGAVVCVAKGTAGSSPYSTQNPPITTTTTPPATSSNPSPTPVTTTVDGGSTVITGAPAGSPAGTAPTVQDSKQNADGSTTTTQQGQDTYCQANPNAAICKQKSECELHPDALGCMQVGDVPTLGAISTKTVDGATFTEANIIQNLGCPAPESVSIGGHAITLSYTPFCTYAESFRPLVLAFAYLTAALLIVGAFKQS